jgi:hypothetical protein
MKFSRILAVAGVTVVLSLISVASALAAGTSVSVRVEGPKRTLLPATTVVAPSTGSITKGGTPKGTCNATTAAGALDVATRHNWGGTYSSGLGVDINTILGQTLSFTHGSYWSVWVDNHYAQAGVCGLKLHRGEQLLFAPYPSKGKVFPIVLTAPKRASTGKPFTVRATYFTGKGSATKPISGVSFTGAKGTTNAKGVATVTPGKAGKLKLVGSRTGYIRSAAQTITVARAK